MRSKQDILETYGKIVTHSDTGGTHVAFVMMANIEIYGRGTNTDEALDRLYAVVFMCMAEECGFG